MKKKFIAVVLISSMVMSLIGCGKTETTTTATTELGIDKDARDEIQKGLDLLKAKEENYIIENAVETADSTIYSITVNTNKGSYVEYPVDVDGNFGTLEFGTNNTMSYQIADWLTNDTKEYYLYSATNAEDAKIYKLNQKYGEFVQSRRYFYVDYMLPYFTYIKTSTPLTYRDDMGELKSLKCFECGLPADKVKDIVTINSYGQYKFTAADENCDPNVKALLDFYIDEMDTPLTFADAKVFVGIDEDGILGYVGIETGGGGNYFYYTMYLIENDVNSNLRSVPDFSNAIDYQEQFIDIAAFIATYPSVAEGLKALEADTTSMQMDGSQFISEENVLEGIENTTEENTETEE